MQGRWDKQRLYRLVKARLGDYLFLVVSNREPYTHSHTQGEISWSRPVSGLTEALDPVMRACGGTWVAYGSGDADRDAVNSSDRVMVPPDKAEYALRRVWLNSDDVRGFYLGFSNDALWPLCHVSFTAPVFDESDWSAYKRVNQIFAEAVLQEVAGRKALVLIQDYHFALLPRLLKEKAPGLTVGQFWHIPWPPYEIFRTCPWSDELLHGLLGNDLIGFHTLSYCHNFLDTLRNCFETKTDRDIPAIVHDGKSTLVEPFPISVDFERISQEAESQAVKRETDRLRGEFAINGEYIGVGMDRVDYTKGIPHRLEALDRFFDLYPQYRKRVVFLQAGMPSRSEIDSYRRVGDKVRSLADEINRKYRQDSWQPVILIDGQLSQVTLGALRQLATFMVVSSLHDGMNLVAKEFVATRNDEDGVLVLSRFAGAAADLRDALIINPYDIIGFARQIKAAIEMPPEERRRRMKAMRQEVAVNNIYRWGAETVCRLISVAERHEEPF